MSTVSGVTGSWTLSMQRGVFVVAYINDANYRFAPEGRRVGAEGPIRLRRVFQGRDLYGKGCPFPCPHVMNPPVCSKGDLPVSEGTAERESCLQQRDLSPPCDERDMKRIVDAVKKVVDNIDALKGIPPCEKCASTASSQSRS